eukprot:1630656-Amphidinium_carterae.1
MLDVLSRNGKQPSGQVKLPCSSPSCLVVLFPTIDFELEYLHFCSMATNSGTASLASSVCSMPVHTG